MSNFMVGELVSVIMPKKLAQSIGYDTPYVEGVVKAKNKKSILIKLVGEEKEIWLPLSAIAMWR